MHLHSYSIIFDHEYIYLPCIFHRITVIAVLPPKWQPRFCVRFASRQLFERKVFITAPKILAFSRVVSWESNARLFIVKGPVAAIV